MCLLILTDNGFVKIDQRINRSVILLDFICLEESKKAWLIRHTFNFQLNFLAASLPLLL